MSSARANAPTGGQSKGPNKSQSSGGSNSMLLELIDRILDKGIVIDAWARISLLSIELLTVEARVVVASVDTYLRYAEAIGNTALASMPHPQQGQQALQGAQQPQQTLQGAQSATGQQAPGLPQPQQQVAGAQNNGMPQQAQQPQQVQQPQQAQQARPQQPQQPQQGQQAQPQQYQQAQQAQPQQQPSQ